MIVNDKSKTMEVKFCHVPVFMEDGVHYLAIEEVYDNLGNCKNAVNLNDGEITYSEYNKMVVLPRQH